MDKYKMKSPKPPKCILSDKPISRLLGIVSPSKYLVKIVQGDKDVAEYTRKVQQYRIEMRIMSKYEWYQYYRVKRLEARHEPD